MDRIAPPPPTPRIAPPGPSPEAVIAADAARLDTFAREFARTGSAVRAYRAAFDVNDDEPVRALWPLASYYLQRPDVQERLRVVRAENEQRELISVLEALRHQVAIAQADPRDIVWTTQHACRYCHGIGGRYQWRDELECNTEYARLADEAVKRNKPLPPYDDSGGFGYTIHNPPNPDCEHCAGTGETRTHIADLRSLDGPAARLIKSVSTDRYGVTKVELHDQLKAWDQVNRMIAAYRDSLDIGDKRKPVELPADATAEQAREHYLALVGGST